MVGKKIPAELKGHKFYADGSLRPFIGNTIVHAVSQPDSICEDETNLKFAGFFQLIKAQCILRNHQTLSQYFGFLPKESFHMTFMDLLNQKNINKKIPELAFMKDLKDKLYSALTAKQDEGRREIDWETVNQAMIDQIADTLETGTITKGVGSMWSVNFDNYTNGIVNVKLAPECESNHNNLRRVVNHKLVGEWYKTPCYLPHITLAYPIKRVPPELKEELERVEIEMNNVLSEVSEFQLEPPYLCRFMDMGHFEPLKYTKNGSFTQPIVSLKLNADEILNNYPPKVYSEKKKLVFQKALKGRKKSERTITYSRWRQAPIPEMVSRRSLQVPVFIVHDGFFDYKTHPIGSHKDLHSHIDWHLNFAHSKLFIAYGGDLFAQDEMQVAEHPVLASVREALLKDRVNVYNLLTVEKGVATPVLIQGVERACSVSTDPNSKELRPNGLYGNNFYKAEPKAIERATKLITPPTTSNIIAMESPSGGKGKYKSEEIIYILATAFTGFCAAVSETKKINPRMKTVIHTGYWGCGAYGGNRVLMPLLQMIAAYFANVDELHFHTGGDNTGYENACEEFERILKVSLSVSSRAQTEELKELDDEIKLSTVLLDILKRNFRWGVSDGN